MSLATAATTTTTAATSSVSTTHPGLSGAGLLAIVGGLLFLALLVVLSPPVLSWIYDRRQSGTAPTQPPAPASFFQIDYITWYLLHFCVAALVVIGVILLAVDGVVDASVVSALLGSLLGYVLGTASQHAATKNQQQGNGTPPTPAGGTQPGDGGGVGQPSTPVADPTQEPPAPPMTVAIAEKVAPRPRRATRKAAH